MKKVIFIGLVIILLLSLLSCAPQDQLNYPKIENVQTNEENTGVTFTVLLDKAVDNLMLKIYKNDFEKDITGTPNPDKTEYTFEATNINPGISFYRKFYLPGEILNGDSLGEFETKSISDTIDPIIVNNNYNLEEAGKMASPLTIEISEKPSGVKEAMIKLTRIDEYGKFEEPRTIYLSNYLMTFEWSTNKPMSYFLTDPTPSTWNYYIKIVDNSGNITITDIGTLTHTN